MKSQPGGGRGSGSRAQMLVALGLDVTYERGLGSSLNYRGGERPVWDFLGGYGATFFGHNHPALSSTMIEFLSGFGVIQAQASIRGASDDLCEKLAERLHMTLGLRYRVILASTGAEAVEIAAKHADFAYAAKRDRLAEWTRAAPPAHSPIDWTPGARHLLDELHLWSGATTLESIEEHNHRVLVTPPVHVAVLGSFHGMTARALELTHDPDGRFGPRVSPSRVRFVESSRTGALHELLADLTQPLLRLRERGGAFDVESIDCTCAAAFFMEPIQGEGGIHPVARETAQAWEKACTERNIPLIADEIQSGMGRTGSFLYAEQLGVTPNYVLLGKSLGGGLSKISAIAIRREEYLDVFSMQHGSTFAEDDLSSRVALRALELLDSENALAIAADKGARLQQALTALAERHPTVVGEVRGAGLMLGLEWKPLDFNRSPALRFLQRYGWLGYAVSGYLLKAHGVRVAPAISQGSTMRLEPAYSVPEEAICRLLDGLEELCTLLEHEDAAGILGPCIGAPPPAPRGQPSPPLISRSPSTASHVGFIGHFIDPDGVALWDPSFSRLSAGACRSYLDQIRPFAEPLLCHRDHVRSVTGAATTLSFIGIPVTSQQCYDALRTGERKELRDLIQRAVDLASSEGCSVIGLGGYCSILTRNGKDLRPNCVALTTGSGYTVGAGLMAMQQAAWSHGIDWSRSRAAVIGATGNIGSVLASLLAQGVSSIVLIGRPGSADALRSAAGKLLCTIRRDAPDSPIAQALRTQCFDGLHVSTSTGWAAAYCRAKCELGDEIPIDVGTDLSLCRDAQLIGAASNHPDSILLPHHLGEQSTVVIDLAVPGDVHDSVIRERPNARVIRGGVIRTPCDPHWSVPGIPLERGEMFACMTETVLMGLERERSHGSFGGLSPERVLQTLAMARKHGFTDIRTRTEST